LPAGDQADWPEFLPHKVSSSDFDELARGRAEPAIVRRLRRAEQSRRKLLLRALDDTLKKAPDLLGPLPPPDDAWDLLDRVERTSPRTLDLVLAHPYTGAWAGYVTRLLQDRITGVCPLWFHLGHLHALAAAAAIRSGIAFDTRIPVWDGGAMLPTLGMARLATEEPWSIAHVRGNGHLIEVRNDRTLVQLPYEHSGDAPNWCGLRRLSSRSRGLRLSVRLDDLDPYRGLYDPRRPDRIENEEFASWRRMFAEAWHMVVRCLPELAAGFPAGLDSLVPRPAVPFKTLSASTEEALGSAIIAQPSDPAALAATLVHEFHHNLLGVLLQLVPMNVDDPRERFYTLWREDPRHIRGVLHGVYSFFGVTEFWRAVARTDAGPLTDRAQFEFGYWRSGTWRTLREVSGDASLTPAGQRFLDGIAEHLGPWQGEPLPTRITELSASATADHLAGWRLRHVRPDPEIVADLTESWLAGRQWPTKDDYKPDPPPTPVPDGTSSDARTELIRLSLTTSNRSLREIWPAVPGATDADFAYVTGRHRAAIDGYLTQLAQDWDDVDSWVGLGLALSANGGDTAAARALLHRPEVVRAVHRQIRDQTGISARPDELSVWIGRSIC
jgi:HEXXH motif-containing protein